MKRFHVHVAVRDLAKSIDFYTNLFGQAPTKVEADYAKWMLENPRVNFAISSRGHTVSVDHFGFQVDNADELLSLKKLAVAASKESEVEQNQTTCCYANSEKHWVIDPQGIAWEHFQTLSEAKTYGLDLGKSPNSCCGPSSNKTGLNSCC